MKTSQRSWKSRIAGRAGALAAAVLLFSLRTAAAQTDAALEVFERDVRPVLVETCQKCHGPSKQEGDLRLDSRDALLRGGDNGPSIVPNEPEKSLLIAAIRQTGELKMPPKSLLSAEKIAAFERWVKLGAPWPASATVAKSTRDVARTHWAFQPVRDPRVPAHPDATTPATNPIDAFVRAKLAAAGLAASPAADRRALIRRATFDLTGLPPTPEEVDAFVRNDDPRAYERLIDRLLASEHYGEQWGRHWLDVARYSDTKGYVYAREQRFWVHAWVYRDWVVKALNDDLPYDRFLLLQIAADQAAPDDRASLAAMGFLTLGRRFLGVTHDIIDDRIDVVTRGTMGLTVACARCHDHKYDPIPTRDYYSLYGIFQNCAERQVPIAEPATRDEAYEAFEKELQVRQKKLDDLLAQRRAEWAARVRARVADYLNAQSELFKYPDEGFDQVLEKDDVLPAFVRRWQSYLALASERHDPVFAPWHAYFQLSADDFAAKAPEVTVALAGRPAGEVHPLVAKQLIEDPQSLREVAKRYGELFAQIESQWQAALKEAADKQLPPPTVLADAAAETLRLVLYGPTAPCEVPDEAMVNVETFFDLAWCEELWKVQGEVDSWLIQSPLAPAHAMILVDRNPPMPARVFKRGRPSNKGEEAPRQFVELLSGADRKPFAHGSGRLELAQAIIDPANPLTARVIVNRVWQHHFGAGLVRTASDFGTRAEPPSHGELLDWLTTRFVEDGWSLKRLHRRIMLSETYRQSSTGPGNRGQGTGDRIAESNSHSSQPLAPSPSAVDPENRLLWRMNQRRLSFEELRDALLSATGELDLRSGGKPADLFAAPFKRRTLYGQVDRQFLPSTLRVFDFANPDLHIPQRSETTVPQQALFFLNHPLMVASAQSLAKATAAVAGDEARVQALYRAAYQRPPTAEQLRSAIELVQLAREDEPAVVSATAPAWHYGYGALDEKLQRVTSFDKLPHFTGSAWQGGPAFPDGKLGWVQLTAAGGHPGNDLAHAAIRRWVAPSDMQVRVQSTLVHEPKEGQGVRGFLVSSRAGLLKQVAVHNGQADLNADMLEVKAGDTLDFVADIGKELSYNQFHWKATITPLGQSDLIFDSQRDFGSPPARQLDPWEQLAQVLLSANEFVFVD